MAEVDRAYGNDVEMAQDKVTDICVFCGAECTEEITAITRCSVAEALAVVIEVTDKHGLVWNEASSSFVIKFVCHRLSLHSAFISRRRPSF